MTYMKPYPRFLASLGVSAAVALLACSAPALAQTYQYPARYAAARPVQWFIDGGHHG